MLPAKGMHNLEFLTIQNVHLRCIGIDINALNGKQLLGKSWLFLGLMCCTIYYKISMINFIIHSGFANVNEISTLLSIFNQSSLILTKFIILLSRGARFTNLIRDINQLAEKANSHERKEWLSENSRAQKISKIYNFACWVTVACAIIFPIIFTIYKYKQTKIFQPMLTVEGKFPSYEESHVLFAINYVVGLIYIRAVRNMTVAVDTMYGWYIYGISGHFRILRCKMQTVGLKLQDGNCKHFCQEIGSIVRYHNRTLGFVAELNVIFGEILCCEVMLSCLQICFNLYSVQNETNMYRLPFNLMLTAGVIIQLMIYCFGGEKLKNESSMLCLDIYLKFPWHSMSPKERKLILLPLMRSQRLSTLRGVFFEVDRNLFLYIMKTAYSINTLLSSVNE